MNWKVEFIAWHEARLVECEYPAEVAAELRRTRDRWLSGVK